MSLGGKEEDRPISGTTAADYYDTVDEMEYLKIVSPLKHYSQTVFDQIVNKSLDKLKCSHPEGLDGIFKEDGAEGNAELVFHQLPERVKAEIWASCTLNYYVPPDHGNEEWAEPTSLTLNFFYPPSEASSKATSAAGSRPSSSMK